MQARSVRQRTMNHVGGSASGKAATTVFLRTAKRMPACKEAGGSLRTQYKAKTSNRSRKSQYPSPPWDTDFPGAFFAPRPIGEALLGGCLLPMRGVPGKVRIVNCFQRGRIDGA